MCELHCYGKKHSNDDAQFISKCKSTLAAHIAHTENEQSELDLPEVKAEIRGYLRALKLVQAWFKDR